MLEEECPARPSSSVSVACSSFYFFQLATSSLEGASPLLFSFAIAATVSTASSASPVCLATMERLGSSPATLASTPSLEPSPTPAGHLEGRKGKGKKFRDPTARGSDVPFVYCDDASNCITMVEDLRIGLSLCEWRKKRVSSFPSRSLVTDDRLWSSMREVAELTPPREGRRGEENTCE